MFRMIGTKIGTSLKKSWILGVFMANGEPNSLPPGLRDIGVQCTLGTIEDQN